MRTKIYPLIQSNSTNNAVNSSLNDQDIFEELSDFQTSDIKGGGGDQVCPQCSQGLNMNFYYAHKPNRPVLTDYIKQFAAWKVGTSIPGNP